MLCRLPSATLVGIDAAPVEVQVDVAPGLPGFFLVGLPAGAVREGAVRIRAALANSDYDLGSMRIIVNLAPADLRKEGAAFDLPIALAALASRELLTISRDDALVVGELALDGRVRPVRGALSFAETARSLGLSAIVLPRANAAEAAFVEGIAAHGVDSLREAAAVLGGGPSTPIETSDWRAGVSSSGVDFSEVRGQREARRAAEVAAAGGHNLMLVGPPGSGKTMIARRVATILPPMSRDEAIETTRVHSAAGLLVGKRTLVGDRPFRAPHHSCSVAGLVGGGSPPRPGEVSLSHNGVLFLDEIPEFPRSALEALRQPLEDGQVSVVRARCAVTFPARLTVVAAMNPCPCGYRGSSVRVCRCGERSAARYRNRISAPLLDRFDLFVAAEAVGTERALASKDDAEGSAEIFGRVCAARQLQAARFQGTSVRANAQMSVRQLRNVVTLPSSTRALVARYARIHALSARAIYRACRVARTIADLAGDDVVGEPHVVEALSLQRARWLS